MRDKEKLTSGSAAEVGKWLMPPSFLLFLVLIVIFGAAGFALLGWQTGVMSAFDIASAGFMLKVFPLLGREAESMRRAAEQNDANRVLLLVTTVGVLFVILVTVAVELAGRTKPDPTQIALVIVTLGLAWTFTNVVYALHYAHLYYLQGPAHTDSGGLAFPDKAEPDYQDFLYFSFTLGMTFQTSDVAITSTGIRRVTLSHGLAAFFFNIGVLSFTVNVLGRG